MTLYNVFYIGLVTGAVGLILALVLLFIMDWRREKELKDEK